MAKELYKNLLNLNDMNKSAEPFVDVNDVSRISAGTVIKGEISSMTDIRVDGKVDGKIYSQGRIVVGEQAEVGGSLLCTNVDFWGRLKGDVYVKDTLSLKSSASVEGNVHVRKLQVEMGAQINGSCKMITEAEYDKYIAEVVTTGLPVRKAEPASAANKVAATAAD